MSSELRLSQLRAGPRRLVQLMRDLGYGRIESLIIHHGEPVFTPAPRVVREIKLDPESVRAPGSAESKQADYVLKSQVRSLLTQLAGLGDGRIENLIVADGLPVRMSIESQQSLLELH